MFKSRGIHKIVTFVMSINIPIEIYLSENDALKTNTNFHNLLGDFGGLSTMGV